MKKKSILIIILVLHYGSKNIKSKKREPHNNNEIWNNDHENKTNKYFAYLRSGFGC